MFSDFLTKTFGPQAFSALITIAKVLRVAGVVSFVILVIMEARAELAWRQRQPDPKQQGSIGRTGQGRL
jgi:hypothetical protein